MKENNIVQIKSYEFALKIVACYKQISHESKEWHLAKQLLRSGTSIGANVEEALGGQSRRDFIAKLSISYKEARETRFWIRLLKDSGYLKEKQAATLLADCEELLKLLGSILKTSKNS